MRGFEIAKNLEKKCLWTKLVANDMICSEEEAAELIMPEYATEHAVGADMKCAQGVVIPSIWKSVFSGMFDGTKPQPTLVHTGIKAHFQEDEVLYLFNRSSNPKKLGLVLANSTGVIECDYYNNESNDGELLFAYYNFFPFDIELKIGDRIGQAVFQKILRDPNLKRGGKRTGGFGSTNK